MFDDLGSLVINHPFRVIRCVEIEKYIAEQSPTRNVLEENHQQRVDKPHVLEGNLQWDEDDVDAEYEENDAVPDDLHRGVG